MKPITLFYLTISVILWPILLISKYYDFVCWQKIAVPLFVTLVFLYSLYLNPLKQKNSIFLFLAFLFVCAGDYILNLTTLGEWFIVPFVLVHINLITYFSRERSWKLNDWRFLVPISLLSSIIYFSMWHKIDSTAELILFGAYLILLSTMLWRAFVMITTTSSLFRKIMIVGGAFLFYITDVSVATNEILDTRVLVAVTWICYVPALVMLSLINFPFSKKNRSMS